MAGRNNRSDVDAEVDLHGLTLEELRMTLQKRWPHWRNLQAVRIVHGQGTVLKPEIVRWCAETGIAYQPDTYNAGALRIFPQQHTLPHAHLANTLGESGLRLTAEEQTFLRDPAEHARAREVERKRLLAEAARKRAEDASRVAERRRDELLWQAEMSRLGVAEKKKGKARDDAKPRPPIVVAPLELNVEEGYWKAEISRVAETDTETLQTQKKTGLDKLAPPMMEEKPGAKPEPPRAARRPPSRDEAAEKALFEAEMERLGGFDGSEIRRAKRE